MKISDVDSVYAVGSVKDLSPLIRKILSYLDAKISK